MKDTRRRWRCPRCGRLHIGFEKDRCRNEECPRFMLLVPSGPARPGQAKRRRYAGRRPATEAEPAAATVEEQTAPARSAAGDQLTLF